METKEIKIYTDGSAEPNPGKGGCGCILLYDGHRKELSAGYKLSTNSRMELMAVIMALEAIKNKEIKVNIYSDSKYVTDSFNKEWLFSWEKNQFRNRENSDLWIKLLALYRTFSKVEFNWVKAHNGDVENEKCDRIANSAAKNPLLEDEEYIKKVEQKNAGAIIK